MNLDTGTRNTTSELLNLYEERYRDIRFSENHDHAYEAVYYFLSLKGKKIRPLLLLHSNQMFGGEIEEALPAAFGLELFHNFTLVHDDIMDKADIRRGGESLHKKYDEGTAIIAGDLMMISAYRYISQVKGHHLQQALDIFNKTALQIMEGQQMDTNFEDRDQVDEKEYLGMIEYKTSVLIATSLQMGALLAEADLKSQKLVYEFGKNLGLAFQIKDDWLDSFGDSSLGKKIGGDILQNKKTYLYVKAWEASDNSQKKELERLKHLSNHEKKIKSTIRIFEELGVKAQTESIMNSYYQKALFLLSEIDLREEVKRPLKNLGENIFNRKF